MIAYFSDPSLLRFFSLPAFEGFAAVPPKKDGARAILKNKEILRYVKKGNVASFLGHLYQEADGFSHILFGTDSLPENSY